MNKARHRKLFNRFYHRARNRAIARLIETHKAEFDRLFDDELVKVQKEQDVIEFMRTAAGGTGLAG